VSYISIDQNSLDEWHDSVERVFNSLAPLWIDLAVLAFPDGSIRTVIRREDEDAAEPFRAEPGESADTDVAL
jgi:hypothetical protein